MKSATVFLFLGLAVVGPVVHAQDAVSLEQMRQTAEQGNADAQLEMGILYEFGYKMPKNDVTALAWYLRAAEQGNELAVKRSETLKSGMKPEDVEAARKLSQELGTKKPEKAQTEPQTKTESRESNPFIIDGESFSKKFIGNPPNGDKLVEFIRENETFENWTKLIGLRYQQLARLENEPAKVAQQMAQMVKSTNPQANSQIVVNDKTSEAIIDFLTWPADGKFMEFNVFRYAKSVDGKAVVSLQLAYRFTDASPRGTENFKKVRASWINQAATFDIQKLHAALE